MKATLTNENIVRVTEEVKTYLEKRKADPKSIYRIRISIEEVLVTYQQAFGTENAALVDMGRHLGKERIRIRIPGERLDPFSAGIEDTDENALLQSYLKLIGQAPFWTYRRGANEISYFSEKKKIPEWAHLFIAIISAIVLGIIIRQMPSSVTETIQEGILSPLLNTFLGFLGAIAGPLVFLSVISSIQSIGDATTFSRIGKHISLLFGVFSVLIAPIAAILLSFGYKLDYGLAEAGGSFSSLFQMILDIIPHNLITPFTEGNMLQILFLAVVIGITMLAIDKNLSTFSSFVDQLGFTIGAIMGAVSRMIPLFVFGSLLSLVVSSGLDLFVARGKFILTVALSCIIILIVHTVMVCVRMHMSPAALWKKTFKTFVIALTTASSGAAFNENMSTCVNKLGIDKRVANFGIPFGQVVYKPSATILYWFASLCVAEISGTDVSVTWLVTAMFTSIVLASASPPVPGGMAVSYAVLFAQLGLPNQELGIMLSISALLDYLLTSTNVFSVQCVLTLSSKGFSLKEGKLK